ncbi:MAG: putative baseplate assembly protein [Pseudomonadota bacterium]
MSGARQSCGTSLRRQRVAESTVLLGGLEINGIDFVEVVDEAAPSEALRQRILEVAFLKAAGVSDAGLPILNPGNFEISGGSRITGIVVEAVELGGAANVLRLTLNRSGDFSPYELRLLATPGADTPPVNMDPRLSCVSFAFKVECPSDFDCKEPESEAPDRPTGPPLDYLVRDYQGFRQLMLDRLAVTVPDWTERNPADLGVMLVEALADAADRASWFQDAVATEAYLGTSRLSQSLRRHARLLGYQPSRGSNARVAVAIEADKNDLSGQAVPKGTRLLTSPIESRVQYPAALKRAAEPFEAMVNAGSIVFETLELLPTLRPARNAMRIHDWGDAACCLAPGATEAWLVRRGAPLGLAVGDCVILEEVIPFGGTKDDYPDPAHRQLVRLTEVETGLRDEVMGENLVRIQWHSDDALAFALNIAGSYEEPGALVRGNVVLADEGRTLDFTADEADWREDEITLRANAQGGVFGDDGPGTSRRVRLGTDALAHARSFDHATARAQPATAFLNSIEPALAQVMLEGAGQVWHAQPDLLSSDRFATNFVVEPREGGGSYARFGDNTLGREPAADTAFKARLRVGGGVRGNVGSDAIRHILLDDGQAIKNLRNPLPATGGSAAETKARTRVSAPHAFKVQRRAVTAQDYVDAAAQHPDVVRAYARRRWTGSWYTITLAVDLINGARVNSVFARDLTRFLEERRLAGHDVKIVDPIFVPLDIVLFVCVKPESYAPAVERELLRVFSARPLGNGKLGYFHPDALQFGEDVALSPIIARAMQVEGVQWIGMANHEGAEIGRFRRTDQPDFDYDDAGAIPIFDGEIARLDNDPSYPDLGTLRFVVEGGR